jgi:hypothetical protein
MKYMGDHWHGIEHNRSTTDQFFAFIIYWRKNGVTVRQHISYSCSSRKPMIQVRGKYYKIIS